MKSLPKMIDHLRKTEDQVMRLDNVFRKLSQEPKGTDCPAIDCLIREADEVAGEVEDKKVLDAAIIGSAQAIEHYEISQRQSDTAYSGNFGFRRTVCADAAAGPWRISYGQKIVS